MVQDGGAVLAIVLVGLPRLRVNLRRVVRILVQRCRNKTAAKKCFRKLFKGCQYIPRVIITDKLKSHSSQSGQDAFALA